MPAIDYEMKSIRNAVEEASRQLAEHPEAAGATDAAATAVREEGLRFRVEGPQGTVSSDMTKAVGGDASAPSPAWLLRAALASCDATLVAMEAARDGIDLTGLEVSVESDSDFRGVLGVDDSVKPGPLAVRVRIQVTSSDARSDQLREIVRPAEMRSPVRDALARALPMATEIVTGED